MARLKRTKQRIDHAARLENPSNTTSQLDVLLYGIGSKIINHHEEKMGLTPGIALGVIREPLANFATSLNQEVLKMGINPNLVGLGLMIGDWGLG